MPLDLTTWKVTVRERLADWRQRMQHFGVDSVYASLCAMTVWPVVEATKSGDWSGLMALGGVFAGLGGNLVAGRIQQWKDKNEREAAQEIAVEAAHNPALRDELDTVLEALNTIAVAQDALRKPDRKWLVETLREELTHLGNLPRFEAHLRGSGAIAQGRKAAAAGKRAVANTGEIRNSVVVTGDGNVVYSGSPTRDPAKALAIYRHVLINSYRHVSLYGLDMGAGDPTGAPQRFDLTQVYVDVLTTTQVPVQRSAKRGRRAETDLEDQRDTRPLSVLEAVGQHRWAVVLGDPLVLASRPS